LVAPEVKSRPKKGAGGALKPGSSHRPANGFWARQVRGGRFPSGGWARVVAGRKRGGPPPNPRLPAVEAGAQRWEMTMGGADC